MFRKLTRLFLYTFAIIIATGSHGFAQCNGSCFPDLKAGTDPTTANYTVYLDSNTLSPEGLAAAQNAIAGWNQEYASNARAAAFTVISNSFAANIVVQDDPSLHGSTTGGISSPGFININPDFDHAADFLKQVMLHEFGHVIGWKDVYTVTCKDQTVMYGIIDPSSYSYLTTLTATDRCASGMKLTPPDRDNRFVPPSGGPQGLHQPGCGDDCSPIVFNFDDDEYHLTGANAPVWFDIMATGKLSHIGWTAADADEAFLWLDRNNNGRVDDGSELFGTATRLGNGKLATNGFEALKEFDSNHDGIIDSRDEVWPHLLLWRDLNHDGVSQPYEIEPLSKSRVVAISLDYRREGRRDIYGNRFRFAAKAQISTDWRQGLTREMVVYDIFFVPVP